MINKIHIQNFRGIRSLGVEKLARINIIIGKNGAGKTSLLEAVGIMANPRAPNWINTYGVWRELPPANLSSDYVFRSIFSDLDSSLPVKFAWDWSGQHHELEVTPNHKSAYTFESTEVGEAGDHVSEGLGGEKGDLSGVTYRAKAAGAVNETVLKLKANGFEVHQTIKGVKPAEIKSPGAFFIHARRATSAGETADVLTKLFEAKEESAFLSALRRINPRISRVIPAVRNKQAMVFFDMGLKRLMPMNLMGDGFCRVCLMLTGLMSHRSKTLIVDEIDSGLHVSVMEEFWDSLIKLSKDQKIQIFCTTHSEEMLRTASSAFASEPSMLNVIRIDSSDGRVSAQGYDFESLNLSMKANLDVR